MNFTITSKAAAKSFFYGINIYFFHLFHLLSGIAWCRPANATKAVFCRILSFCRRKIKQIECVGFSCVTPELALLKINLNIFVITSKKCIPS